MTLFRFRNLFIPNLVLAGTLFPTLGLAQVASTNLKQGTAPSAPPAAATGAAAGTLASSAKPGVSADEPIFIDIGRAGVRKLKMAIPSFGATAPNVNASASDRDADAQRLSDILDFTSAFEFMPTSGFLAKGDFVTRAPNYDEWTPVNAELLIFGKFEPSGTGTSKKSLLDLRLFDARKKTMLVGKRYTVSDQKSTDAALRQFADRVIEALTGQPGIFSSKLAFIAAKHLGDPRQVFLANFDGTDVEQLTDNKSINMSPSWSPDGSKLTYTTFKDGKAEIYEYNFITKKHYRMTRSPGNNSGATWSPDGKTIAFSGNVDSNTSIYTMNAIDGSNRSTFITGSGLEVEPAYSPDGKKLAFASGRFGHPHIFVRDLPTGKDTRITIAGWFNSTPNWRPDGKKLVFAGFDRDIDRYDIFMVNPDGRAMERLTLDQGDNEKPVWSADGNFILFQSNRSLRGKGKDSTYRLWIMNRDGGDQKPLKISLPDCVMPAWSPRLKSYE